MGATPSHRQANRARLREALVAAARDLTVERGWDGVRMVDVAKAAGVSRQTVYNEFGRRDGLAEALALSDTRAFVATVRAELFAHGPDVRAAGTRRSCAPGRRLPATLRCTILTTSDRGGADQLLPFLTTLSAALLAAGGALVAEWAEAHLPGHPTGHRGDRRRLGHPPDHQPVLQPLGTTTASADAVTDVSVRLLNSGHRHVRDQMKISSPLIPPAVPTPRLPGIRALEVCNFLQPGLSVGQSP